jgi:hypothetical protein
MTPPLGAAAARLSSFRMVLAVAVCVLSLAGTWGPPQPLSFIMNNHPPNRVTSLFGVGHTRMQLSSLSHRRDTFTNVLVVCVKAPNTRLIAVS